MLESTEPSLLIIEARACQDIVVGVPHHAPAGKASLPCPGHPNSDENAGFLGRYLAETLNCCSIIACNYTVDVNKYFRTDYSMQIAYWNPKVLVEIHGHGGSRAHSDIEISSGGPHNDRFSKPIAEMLQTAFSTLQELKGLSVCGEYSKLFFTASSTVTISDGRWVPYHIELPPLLRKPLNSASGKPPAVGYQFCDILANLLKEIHGS